MGKIEDFREMHGFHRIAACVPALKLADPASNAEAILELARKADAEGAAIALFPELALCGYTCADLFHNRRLLDGVDAAVERLLSGLADSKLVTVVGLPHLHNGRLYNCAAVLQSGIVHGLVPKSLLPNYREFYERRWFASGMDLPFAQSAELAGQPTLIGPKLLFAGPGNFKVGVEICEDLWGVIPPSSCLALAGATILLNPSASDALVAKADYRRELVRQQSARCLAAYAYASAGVHESSTDLVYGGHSLIAENGALLGRTNASTARRP
jgi:NAD+ synthase (glutamine-hydrolysing)